MLKSCSSLSNAYGGCISVYVWAILPPAWHADGTAVGETQGRIYNLPTRDGHSACPLVRMIGCNDTLHAVPVPQLFLCWSFFSWQWFDCLPEGGYTDKCAAQWERCTLIDFPAGLWTTKFTEIFFFFLSKGLKITHRANWCETFLRCCGSYITINSCRSY